MDQIWEDEISSWKFRNLEREKFLEIVKSIDGKILEVGPGYGRVINELNGKDITGLELSDNLAEKLKSKVPETVDIVIGDIADTDFNSDAFDAVVMEEVIEHIGDQEKVIAEIQRILKPNGRLVLTTPNKYVYRSLMYLNNLRKGRFSLALLKNPTHGHVAECTAGDLKRLLKDFEIEHLIGLNPYLPHKLEKKFAQLAIGFIVVAKNI